MVYSNFFSFLKEVSEKFKKIDKSETIRLISHHDADGICSASIMIRALENENYKYNLSIIKQLTEIELKQYQNENFNNYVFTDLGSGQYNLIKKYLAKKTIFIFDHHTFDLNLLKNNSENIIMVNPHMFNIDGSNEISGSGVSYLFAQTLNEKNKELSYLAIIGSIGDVQENNGFSSLNKYILDIAINQGKIKIEKNLKYYGLETKPLYYLLAYGDIYIPNISGKESNAIQFLNDIGIEPKINGKWKKFNDLNEKEKKQLISSIIIKRSTLQEPENIIGNRYLLVDEPESSPLRDLKEFATLINACGRLEKASLGIGLCLNNPELKKKALQLQDEYRKEIINALNWYEKNNSQHIIKSEKYIIINAKNNIMPSIIGTIASIISNSDIPIGTLVLALAYDNDSIKASLRIKTSPEKKETLNLRDLLVKLSEKTSCQAGGHKNAAGAIIPKEKEELFINEFIKLTELENY
ncbi:MAG: DHH family phosphoesterase [Candidatus Woesearchaeota archaeon]